MRKLLMSAGSTALIVGICGIAFGVFGSRSAVYAGENGPIPCDATATPTIDLVQNEAVGNPQFVSFQQENTATPVPTCTPTRPPFTHTPTPSLTPAGTATPVPDTPVPASPTNTPEGEPGVVIAPPTTGSGPSEGGMNPWFVLAGLALLALGGGALAAGARRR